MRLANVALGLPFQRSAADGSPAPPAWVQALQAPSGDLPTLAADFKNGNYWANGALTTLADMFYENTNVGPWNATGVVDDQGLGGNWDVNGDPQPDRPPSFPNVATDLIPTAWLTAGATLLMQTFTTAPTTVGQGIGAATFLWDSPDFSILSALEMDYATGGALNQYDSFYINQLANQIDDNITPTPAVCRAVINQVLTLGTMYGSTNGGTVQSQVTTLSINPATDLNINCYWDNGPTDPHGTGEVYVTLWAAYDLQPHADLATMSVPS